jgi:hypothetical protein
MYTCLGCLGLFHSTQPGRDPQPQCSSKNNRSGMLRGTQAFTVNNSNSSQSWHGWPFSSGQCGHALVQEAGEQPEKGAGHWPHMDGCTMLKGCIVALHAAEKLANSQAKTPTHEHHKLRRAESSGRTAQQERGGNLGLLTRRRRVLANNGMTGVTPASQAIPKQQQKQKPQCCLPAKCTVPQHTHGKRHCDCRQKHYA